MAVGTDGRTPTPSAMMKGTVMGPVVTPPESKATARNSFGTNAARRKDGSVKDDQQPGQRDAQQHTQEGHDEEDAHAHSHREDEGHVGDGGYLVRKHLVSPALRW